MSRARLLSTGLAAVALPLALAACGAQAEEVATAPITPSPSTSPSTSDAPTTPAMTVDTYAQAAAIYWDAFEREHQDTICEVLLGEDQSLRADLTEHLTSGDYTPQEVDAIYTHAEPVCEGRVARADSAEPSEDGETVPKEPATEPAARTFGPGTYLVPEEVAPGTYRATQEVDGCLIDQTDTRSGDPVDYEYASTGKPTFTVKDVRGSQIDVSPGCGLWEPLDR